MPVLKKIDSQAAHLALHPISKKYCTTANIYFMCLFSEIEGDRVTGLYGYIYIVRKDSILDMKKKWIKFLLYVPFHEQVNILFIKANFLAWNARI
jgi:hypothetical protein